MINNRYLSAVVGCFAVAVALMVPITEAESAPKRVQAKTVTISGNSGGRIGDFVIMASQYRAMRARIRFTGRCDSACTLLLALPRHQVCVAPGAKFRFHAPSAGSQRTAMMAKSFMMRKYPGWVRSWISRNKGLTSRLITMDARYATRFLPACSTSLASL